MSDITLYTIDSDFRCLMDEVAEYAMENDGVIPDEMAERLNAVEGAREQKIANCARYTKELDATLVALKAERDRISKRVATTEKRAKWMKDYISAVVPRGEKHEDATYRLGWRKSPPSVVVDAPVESLPDRFVTIKTEVSPDKVKLKEALQGGEVVEGVTLVTDKYTLSIK